MIWGILLNPNNGAYLTVFSHFRHAQQQFLIDQKTGTKLSYHSNVLLERCVAYWMMFLLAGLQGIPESLYEAAKVEGCGTFSTIFYIVLPMLKRSIAFVLVADTVVNLLTFAPMYSLTSGVTKSIHKRADV
ncbi:MAG: carbohydrate ABC transporter permease [Waltera sp.]